MPGPRVCAAPAGVGSANHKDLNPWPNWFRARLLLYPVTSPLTFEL
jgi:hypothetical protein